MTHMKTLRFKHQKPLRMLTMKGGCIDKKEKSVALGTKYVKVDGKGGMKKKVGVVFYTNSASRV